MKTKILFTALLAAAITSCSDDDNATNLQAHDRNEMMSKMHDMMVEMNAMTMTNDPDVDFATMMIMHHEGAIAMANLELEKGTDSQMRTLAQNVITAQTQEIQMLQGILSGITVDDEDMGFMMEMMASMDVMDATADTQLITGNIDNDFATLMIVHHQSAIDNASSYLHHGSNSELTTMANNIVNDQSQEIIDIAEWLTTNRR